jgi:uracil-DNA glycosylase
MRIKVGALQKEYWVKSVKQTSPKNIYPKDSFKYYPDAPPIINSHKMYHIEVPKVFNTETSTFLLTESELKTDITNTMIQLYNNDLVIEDDWYNILKEYFISNHFKDLLHLLKEEKKNHIIYPSDDMIFAAYNLCRYNEVKVVIVGQDPYHNEGQAHGLAFSVPEGVMMPPSLENIVSELTIDINNGLTFSSLNGDLRSWAEQGVLLLNNALTVRKGQPNSHSNIGWEVFTNYTITELSRHKSKLIFILWGKYAQSKEIYIDLTKHYVIKGSHPSPFSAYKGFFGGKYFSKCNEILKFNGIEEINWKSIF